MNPPAKHFRPRVTAPHVPRWRDAWVYLGRALRLRCPECGVSPIFIPWHKTRSVRDWYAPLDGCPRCGYGYEREEGYFLMAIWGVHYFTVAGFGLVLGLVLEHFLDINVWLIVPMAAVPTVLFGFYFARHAKAIYLAVDHFFDPHVRPPAPPPREAAGKQG